MIAQREFLCQGGQDRELIGSVTSHDLARVGRIDPAIGGDESAIRDMGIRASGSAQLFLHTREFMARIIGHGPVGWGTGIDLVALGSRFQSFLAFSPSIVVGCPLTASVPCMFERPNM